MEFGAGLCPGQSSGDPQRGVRCGSGTLAALVIHSVRNSLGKEKSVHDKFSNEVIQNQTSVKDVLLLG